MSTNFSFMNRKISGGTFVAILIAGIVLLIIEPFILFWLGYFSGWLTKLVIGNTLAGALNAAFNTTYFSAALLPKLGGVLAWIGSFFKNTARLNTNNN